MAIFGAAAAFAEASDDRSSDLLGRYSKAVVAIDLEVIAAVSINGRILPPRTLKHEVNGTVITRSGLTVTSLSAFDPSMALTGPEAASNKSVTVEQTEFANIKLHLVDGTEIPARLVCKRAELDLVFLAPEGAEILDGVFAPLALENGGESATLAICYEMSRAPKVQKWTPMIRMVQMPA